MGGVCKKIKALSGLDLYAYKPRQMRRRLGALMEKMGASDWVQFARILERRPQALKEFKDFLTINVSEFFRGADKFLQLRDEVIPQIVSPGRTLSIWSAGCSVGAEPYTLAMIIDSLRLASRARIMASDIDQTVIDRARSGDGYNDLEVKEVPAEYLKKYFKKTDSGWEVIPRIRSQIRFQTHNLLKDSYAKSMDLIVCRNVVIYFTDEAKDHVYRGFYESLAPGGYLFVGGTEIIGQAKKIGFESPAVYF